MKGKQTLEELMKSFFLSIRKTNKPESIELSLNERGTLSIRIHPLDEDGEPVACDERDIKKLMVVGNEFYIEKRSVQDGDI